MSLYDTIEIECQYPSLIKFPEVLVQSLSLCYVFYQISRRSGIGKTWPRLNYFLSTAFFYFEPWKEGILLTAFIVYHKGGERS